MKKAKWVWLAALIALGLPSRTQAQNAFSDGGALAPMGPAFAADPQPVPAPEFCPAPPAPVRSAVPLADLCCTGNGFGQDCPKDVVAPHWYLGLGGMALRRTQLSRGNVAFLEPAGAVPNPDTGNPPPAGSAVIANFQDVPTPFAWGIRGTIGIPLGPHAFEFTGYYLFEQSTNHTATAVGQIDVPFFAFPTPAGFAGYNNLWLQADQVTIGYSTTIGNMEGNFRYQHASGLELLLGVRYFDLDEKLNIFTDDNSLLFGRPAPLGQANYAFDVHSRIVAPQIGVELEKLLVPIVSVGFSAKGAAGPNFLNVQHTLERGDGLQGPGGTRNPVILSGLTEIGLFTNLYFNERFRLRLGYQALWVLHIPEAQQQVSFNPNLPLGNVNDNGSIFFHGPLFEFQLNF